MATDACILSMYICVISIPRTRNFRTISQVPVAVVFDLVLSDLFDAVGVFRVEAESRLAPFIFVIKIIPFHARCVGSSV